MMPALPFVMRGRVIKSEEESNLKTVIASTRSEKKASKASRDVSNIMKMKIVDVQFFLSLVFS
jgi:hypothetical protein